MKSNRRDFLKGAAVLTAATAALPAATPQPRLPTVKLGKYEVTRLIAGSNPQYGYSHFNNLYDQHMREYHTQERVVEFLKAVEAAGINTWQAGYNERMGPDIERFREEGGKLQLICLARPDFIDKPERIREAAGYKPFAIVQHGMTTERMWRRGEFQKSRDYLKRVRDAGVMVGVSTHYPAVIEKIEGEDWDVDFFMVCFYYVIRPRDEIRKMLGDAPLGECFLESDPPRACAAIRQSRKPCLAFKILGAGRASDMAEQRRSAFEFAFHNIKPGDAVIVGMLNRYSDQAAENAALTRTLLQAAA